MPSQEFIALLAKILEGDEEAGLNWNPNPEEAEFTIPVVTDLLRDNPNHGHALSLCGYMHKHGQWTGGVKDIALATHFYDRGVACGSVLAMNNRAYVYFESEGNVNLAEIKALCLRALAIKPDSCLIPNVLNKLGDMYLRENNYLAAIEVYEIGIKLRSSHCMMGRAALYVTGQGTTGKPNYPAAINLWYCAYAIDQNPQAFRQLQDAADSHITEAIEKFFLICFKQKKWHELNWLYMTNNITLKKFIFETIISHVDSLAFNEDYLQSLIDFYIDKTNPAFDDIHLNYIRFKLALAQQNPIETRALYRRLASTFLLTARDLYELGHLFLGGAQGLDNSEKILQLNLAAECLYFSFRKGYKDAYSPLLKLLRDKEALENKACPVDITLDTDGVTQQQGMELVNRFMQKIKQKDNSSTISFFNGYIATKKHRIHKKNKEEESSKSLQVAQDLIKGLNQGLELHEVISLEENRSRIKSRGGFFTLLAPLLEKTGHSLSQLLKESSQSAPGTEPNNMQLVIYQPNNSSYPCTSS